MSARLRNGGPGRYAGRMPLRSMTGFGSAAEAWASADGPLRIEVEIRSVNARFLELKVRQPFGGRIEPLLRRRVERRLGRGRVELAVHLRRDVADDGADVLGAFGLDETRVVAAARVLGQIERISAREKLELSRSNPAELLRFLHASSRGSDALPEPPPFLESLVDQALEELCRFRAREGQALQAAIVELVDALTGQVDAIEATLPDEEARLTARWVARVQELCERVGVSAFSETDRVAHEVAVLVARGDVAEELARIRSHLDQLRDVLAADPTSGQGKTLDFLSQELLREITTIGSKITSHAGSRVVIEAKGTIERVREQVQNVE
jgi:uncharacterized protein (TIGR00255 family)